jgi:phosphate uptake regulator
MSEQVPDMFQRPLTAFIQEDAQAARIAQEERADRRAVFAGLCRSIDLVSHPYNMQRGNYVLCVAHNLERTANGVTNVRERMLFIATGELSEISNTLRHPVRY